MERECDTGTKWTGWWQNQNEVSNEESCTGRVLINFAFNL